MQTDKCTVAHCLFGLAIWLELGSLGPAWPDLLHTIHAGHEQRLCLTSLAGYLPLLLIGLIADGQAYSIPLLS